MTLHDICSDTKDGVKAQIPLPACVSPAVLLFPGWGNPVVSYRKYLISFNCDFDLTRYPFDLQICSLLLQLTSAARDNIRYSLHSCSLHPSLARPHQQSRLIERQTLIK